VNSNSDCHVILMPGLWMPAWVMIPLQRRIVREGFSTVRFGYASARADLTANAERLARFIEAGRFARIHLVGHSLGGIVALHATASHALRAVHRVVMLGSPYRDSYAARELARSDIGRWMLGRTVPEWLGATRYSIPPSVEVGVIAGTVAFGLGTLVARGLPRPHDGVVSVAETSVSGMKASTQAAVSHSQMVLSRDVARLVSRFLLQGHFASQEDARVLESVA
jgi:pimeloyl-ACP methyl ester carboxylesterase